MHASKYEIKLRDAKKITELCLCNNFKENLCNTMWNSLSVIKLGYFLFHAQTHSTQFYCQQYSLEPSQDIYSAHNMYSYGAAVYFMSVQ